MTELAKLTSEHDIHLNSACINLSNAVRMIEELLQPSEYISPKDRDSTLADVINKCNWAIDYLYRARSYRD